MTNAYVPASDPDNDIVGLVVDGQDRVTLATLYDDYETIALHRFTAGVADSSFGVGGEVLESSLGRVEAVAVDSLDRVVLTGLVGVPEPAPRRSARRVRHPRPDLRRRWYPE